MHPFPFSSPFPLSLLTTSTNLLLYTPLLITKNDTKANRTAFGDKDLLSSLFIGGNTLGIRCYFLFLFYSYIYLSLVYYHLVHMSNISSTRILSLDLSPRDMNMCSVASFAHLTSQAVLENEECKSV